MLSCPYANTRRGGDVAICFRNVVSSAADTYHRQQHNCLVCSDAFDEEKLADTRTS